MFNRMIRAGIRAALVAMLIMFPALMLRGSATETTQIVVLLAILAAILTFAEYFSRYPSVIEFRNAPPFNRLRFAALFLSVVLLTAMNHRVADPTVISSTLNGWGMYIGRALDFPLSPIHLMMLLMPPDVPLTDVQRLCCQAGVAYVVSLLTMLVFVFLVRFMNWPSQSRAFNFWVNLPSFDPTAGGDVIYHLRRDARVNVALGVLLPYLIPVVMKAATYVLDPATLGDPQTLIWMMTAWAYLPASMMMRGIALYRIADLIRKKRSRAHAQADFQSA
ncbi:hypothetical protein [Puniceibacterium sediminis]|uniref:Uncharacterized protein n=1 Tax=Puniceibacterium sediminis TaxID=1608407 RepID=A0A238VUP4_9RHOB|nr:hypothetical protein [Puniceibacterium sediminis]SNR37877.1 hypothetical protein SAMN06265370_103172 [Puniceibacterium sediminis]